MTKQMFIRYVSPEGGVSLFVNGFLVFGADEKGRAVSQAAPYLRPGENIFELAPSSAEATAELNVVDLSNGSPETAPTLLSMSTNQALSPGAPIGDILVLETSAPAFGWHRAAPIDDIASHRTTLYRGLETLARLLQFGPDAELLRILDMKHDELADSVGLARNEMDDGLLSGLAQLRATPGFFVDLAAQELFDPVVSSSGRIVNARRQGGGDALRVIDGIENPGFSVAIARIEDRWMIVR